MPYNPAVVHPVTERHSGAGEIGFGPRERGPAASFGGSGGPYGGSSGPSDSTGSFWDPTGLTNKSGLRGWNESPAYKLAQQKQGFDQQRFQSVWDTVLGQFNNMAGGFGAFGGAPGGQSGQGPEITTKGVYTQPQIDQQVNAAKAGNDAATAARTKAFSADAAGRGFAPNSPLALAMAGRFQNQNLATNADAEREIRQGAGEKNAGLLLKQQQAREQQFASRMDEDIRRRTPMYSLLGTLAGLA
jgi:hypothetical protein